MLSQKIVSISEVGDNAKEGHLAEVEESLNRYAASKKPYYTVRS